MLAPLGVRPSQERVGQTIETVGIKQADERIWLVSFMHYDLGYFNDKTCRLEPPSKPIRAKSVTYVCGMNRYLCLRAGHSFIWRSEFT